MASARDLSREGLRAVAARHSWAELAEAEAEVAEGRARALKREYEAMSAQSLGFARIAREKLGSPEGHEAFERHKMLHGSARTLFALYRRAELEAQRKCRVARLERNAEASA